VVKRSHAPNPAKVKADAAAGEALPPEVLRRRVDLRRRITILLLNALTVVLLTVSFAPFDCWYLAYVALIPWLLALRGGQTFRPSLLWPWLAGGVFWVVSLYWLWPITVVGYLALVVYLSLYWLVAAAVLRAALRRDWPMWLVLPVVWVGLEYARAYVISGFPWFYLAHSQYTRTWLIQIADLTGQYGVSFLVAMVNGALVDLLDAPLFARSGQGRAHIRRELIIGPLACTLAAGAMLSYGAWRVSQHAESTRPGPVIGIVQEAFPIVLGSDGASGADMFAKHLASSEEFADSGCQLLLWPETMMPKGVNAAFLSLDTTALSDANAVQLASQLYISPEHARSLLLRYQAALRSAARQMGQLSRQLDCPILAGGATVHRNLEAVDAADAWVTRNSALLFDRRDESSAIYSKVHLVPFSEYVPFRQGWPALHRLLRKFVPPVMEQLDPGPGYTRIEVPAGGQRWVLGVPICYEGTFARICRRLVAGEGGKKADLLVNLSNDGWFVWRWGDGPYRGTTEQTQHLVQYCFRAVENRVPVVRAVNTGISASIDSCGRIVAMVEIRIDDYVQRVMVPGRLLLDGGQAAHEGFRYAHGPKVLVDRRVSLYSRIGDVFAMVVAAAAVVLAGWLIFRRHKSDRVASKG